MYTNDNIATPQMRTFPPSHHDDDPTAHEMICRRHAALAFSSLSLSPTLSSASLCSALSTFRFIAETARRDSDDRLIDSARLRRASSYCCWVGAADENVDDECAEE